MEIDKTKINATPDDYSRRLARAYEILAETLLEGLRYTYDVYARDDNSADRDGDAPVPFDDYVAHVVRQDGWVFPVIAELKEAVENAKEPNIHHVYYDNGRHCILANGTRGFDALYESPAEHPDGYIALTDYYGGDVWAGNKSAIPSGGQVFAVMPVEHSNAQTVLKSVADYRLSLVGSDPNGTITSMGEYHKENKVFNALYPLAYESMPEYRQARDEIGYKEEVASRSDNDEDWYCYDKAKWVTACQVRHGGAVTFENHNREPYGPGISAWKEKIHVGEFRCDTSRGTVYT